MGGSLPPFFMKFDFQFGKKKSSIFRYAVIGVVFTSLVTGVSQCTHIPEENIYDFIDEVQRKYFPQTDLNDIIINTPQLLDRRVHRDVDKAIKDYEDLTGDDGSVRISPSYFSEKAPDKSNAQKLLGGEMRICGSWIPDCPKENQVQ
jgi:hypothetical protein